MKRKAQMRMIEAREPAMAQLIRIINDKSVSDADKLKAVKLVLDRTDPVGVKLDATVELKPWQRMLGRIGGGVPDALGELSEEIRDGLEAMDAEDLRRQVQELRRENMRLRSIPGEVVPRAIESAEARAEARESRTSVRAELPPAPPKAPETVAAYEDHTPSPHDSARKADREIRAAQALQAEIHERTGERRHVPGGVGTPAGQCFCDLNEGLCAIHRPPSADPRFSNRRRR